MADKTISELVAATEITATDLFVLEQNNTAKKLTGQILENWLVSYAEGHGGIQTIVKTGSSGTNPVVDTYTITLADTTTKTFTVTNGIKGDAGQSYYVHIKYSAVQPTQDSDMGDIPDKWMGVYSGTSSTAPTTYTSYKWYEIKGAKGDTGSPSTITTNVIDYQESSSGTVIPTGDWSATVPTVTQGNFLWTRTRVTYNTSPATTVTSYSVAYYGVDGEGAVSSVNGQSGVVVLDGSDINVDDTAATPVTIASELTSHSASIVALETTEVFTVTLAVADWSNNQQTITNAKFLTSGYAYTVCPASASYADWTSAIIYADDVTIASNMTFHCTNVPTSAITVSILKVRVF